MNCLDSSMDTAKNSRFLALHNSLIRQLTGNTHFSESDITSLLMIYYKLCMSNGPKESQMLKSQFYQIFPVLFQINNLRSIDRTILYITTDPQYVSGAEWIKLFELFTTRDLSVQMEFAFEAYNTKGSGFIDTEQITIAVEMFFSGEDEDEVNEMRVVNCMQYVKLKNDFHEITLQDMTEIIIKKFDVDKDGLISYEDYSTVVSQQPCLLEFLGPLFPSPNAMEVIAHCANIECLLTLLLNK